MRVPFESYLQGKGTKVFSLVVDVPFSPLDIDLAHLARGEWNPLVDRFRLWYLPPEEAEAEPVCYLMVRKFDPQDGVLVCGHMVVDFDGGRAAKGGRNFTVGVLSNDEIRARAMLNSMLDIPPAFHRRCEVKLVEKKWRSDSEAVMRFLANVHSTVMNLAPYPSGRTYALKFEPPSGMIGDLKRGMGAWWQH